MDPLEAANFIEQAHIAFTFTPDTPDVYRLWLELVTDHRVSGRQVHDAHVAAMLAHGLSSVLTLDGRDFHRYAGITLVPPESI